MNCNRLIKKSPYANSCHILLEIFLFTVRFVSLRKLITNLNLILNKFYIFNFFIIYNFSLLLDDNMVWDSLPLMKARNWVVFTFYREEALPNSISKKTNILRGSPKREDKTFFFCRDSMHLVINVVCQETPSTPHSLHIYDHFGLWFRCFFFFGI